MVIRVGLQHLLNIRKATGYVFVSELITFLRSNPGYDISVEITGKVIVGHGPPFFKFSGNSAALYLLDKKPVDVPSFAECSAARTPNPTNKATVAPLAGGPGSRYATLVHLRNRSLARQTLLARIFRCGSRKVQCFFTPL